MLFLTFECEQSMNVADGSLVGMRILPAGLVASDSCSEGDDSCDDSLTADGPCLFLLTSKVSYTEVLVQMTSVEFLL